jgi:hypothetical protein
MFRRILDMRSKLEGIIQLQTIKYQRQLALMLRDSKQKQREAELAQILAQQQQAGAGAGESVDDGAVFCRVVRRLQLRWVHPAICPDGRRFLSTQFLQCSLRVPTKMTNQMSVVSPADGAQDQSTPMRIFGNKHYPPPIKTTFTPSLGVLESPSHFGSSHAITPEGGGGGGGVIGSSGSTENSSPSSKRYGGSAPRLGSNIYASNLKMIGKIDEEEEKAAAAALAKPKEANVD